MPRVLGCGVLACVEYRPLDGLLAGVTHRPGDDITLWSPSWTIEGLPTEVQYILYHTITISAVMGPYANTADHHGPLASATKPEQFQQSCFTEYCVTWRTLQTPGTAEENKRQETPTTNPNDRQPAQGHTKHQALSKGQQDAQHQPAQQPCTPPAQQPPAIIAHTQQGHHQILSANAARCEAQAG